MNQLFKIFLFLFLITQVGWAQHRENIQIHSHNDYAQPIPFWTAYNVGFSSIEIDVIAQNNQVYVAHDRKDITSNGTIENLYILPFIDALKLCSRAHKVSFLIDFKTDFEPTFELLDSLLQLYPRFRNNATLIISGNRPKASDFVKYPTYILFDFQEFSETITPVELERVGMYSYNFKKLSGWNGTDEIDDVSRRRLKKHIKMAHDNSKPIRFWASPDTEKAWATLSALGVDYINTNKIREAAAYFDR